MLKWKKIEISSYELVYDLTYIASDKGQGCGGELFNYGGSISSPMYPLNDRNYSDCRWIINVPQNLVVALQFESNFHFFSNLNFYLFI